MTGPTRWRIDGVSPETRELARDAARRRGIGIGDWLDEVIRHQTGLPTDVAEAAATSLPADEVSGPESSSDDSSSGETSADDGNAEPGDSAPFFAAENTPSEEDIEIADATVAADLERLLDESQPSEVAAAEPGGRQKQASTGRRSMLVAAGIVIVAIAIVFIIYRWTIVPVAPDPAAPVTADNSPVAEQSSAPPQPPRTQPTDDANASSGTDSSQEIVTLPEPDSLGTEDTATQVQPTKPQQQPDLSLVRPARPALPETGPIAALYRAAEDGMARAQFDLAILHLQGNEVPQDYPAAGYWLREAAQSGLATAQYNLGVMYDLGLAGRRDPVEALLWFHAAADQGHARANYALGLAFAEGKGLARDNTIARNWFHKGAEAGVADSQLALGIMYDEGLGGDADTGAAYYWYRLAEINGNDRAAERIAALGDSLTAKQRAAINDAVSRDVTGTLGQRQPSTSTKSSSATSVPRPTASTSASAAADKETVRAVQRLLAELGFDAGPADGDAGPRTRAAVEAYQRALGLPVNGRPDADLLTHLRNVAGL